MADAPAIHSGPYLSGPSDYAHSRHAGNAGDVFKHVALAAALRHFAGTPLRYVETHAGDGIFTLGSVGEWTAGVQRLWPASAAQPGAPGCAGRWFEAVRRFSRPEAARPERYPGSPLLARALLGPQAQLVLHELQPLAAQVLGRALGQDPRAEVRLIDGFAALGPALAEGNPGQSLALIDPPYTHKGEWSQAAQAIAAARVVAPAAALLLWYPIKALTRPRALLAELVRLGVHGTVVELFWTPLRLHRERLNGSGMIFIQPPPGAVEELCAALPLLGPPLATHGEWSAQQIGF